MDELLKQIARDPGLTRGFTVVEFSLSLALSVALALVIALVYRQTHTGLSYSRSFVMSMILMSLTISFIMLIIGTNLARAFSLVGALSIIRYRNALKDSRDTAYIFLTMAVGMACGTRLYGMAAAFTLAAAAVILVLDRITFGEMGREERLMQFSFDRTHAYGEALEGKLKGLSRGRYLLLSSELLEEKKVLVYSVEMPPQMARDTVLDQFRSQFAAMDVKMLTGFEKFNI
jgi:hypothetical protein